MNELADVVRRERLRRGLSVRQAAKLGDISNTWWQRFEDYLQPMTDSIRVAVAKAYGWSDEWPAEHVSGTTKDHPGRTVQLPVEVTRLPASVAGLETRVESLERRVELLLKGRVEDLGAQLRSGDGGATQADES